MIKVTNFVTPVIMHSQMAQQVILLGKMYGYTYTVLPYRGEIPHSVEKDSWLYTPIEQDPTEIGHQDLCPLDPLYECFVPIEQILIGHEMQPTAFVEAINHEQTDNNQRGAVYNMMHRFYILIASFIHERRQKLLKHAVVSPVIIVVLGDADHTWIQITS